MDAYKLAAGIPWAITEEALRALIETVDLRGAWASDRYKPSVEKRGAVAVIPIRGVIQHHGDIWSMFFGDTTVDGLAGIFREAMADSDIKAIVFDIDSPGGTVAGVGELADEVMKARGTKPIVAVANATAASAAYWLGAASDAFYAAPSALVGSIGVYMLHMDFSEALAKDGIKPTFVKAGEHKVDANPYEPLEDEAAAHLQSIVDDSYSRFVRSVAKGRGVSEATVRNSFGQGRVFPAKVAKEMGLIDGIYTLDQAIARATKVTTSAVSEEPAAEGEGIEPVADEEGQKRLGRLRWQGLVAAQAAI